MRIFLKKRKCIFVNCKPNNKKYKTFKKQIYHFSLKPFKLIGNLTKLIESIGSRIRAHQ